MNSNLASGGDAPATSFRRLFVLPRWLPLLLIAVAAAIYYGSYLRYWFNPHDESGTACLIAQRLMQGERPWVDVETGYNIGWFYPLMAIFHFTGVNFIVARAWFFLLATITALLGYGIVARVTGSRWLGLGVGLALVALPGSQFKNYIPLAEAANVACLLALLHTDPRLIRGWLARVAGGGVVLGLTLLVRVELGIFFGAIWLGVLALVWLETRLPLLRRMAWSLAGAAILASAAVVVQVPPYLELRARGVEEYLIDEYASWFGFLRNSIQREARKPTRSPAMRATPVPPAAPAAPVPPEPPAPVAPAPDMAAPLPTASTIANPVLRRIDGVTLQRQPLAAMVRGSSRDRLLSFCTYAPLLGFGIFLAAGSVGFCRVLFRGAFTLAAAPLQALVVLGGSLTTFPQFFFFRPDRPHLSEFMPGYIIASAACAWIFWPRRAADSETVRTPAGRRFAAVALAIFLGAHFAAYATFAMQHPSAGTVAARFRGRTWFEGENGVRVRGTKREAAEFTMVREAVRRHSRAGDYVICFPYMPGYNLMTDRRTYLRDMYVDNATRTAQWPVQTVLDFELRKPAIVIVDDRAINGVEISRFSRWAPGVLEYLRAHYTLAGKHETIEVFARPGSAP